MTEREKIINIVEQNKYCDVNTAANCRECKYNKELENYNDMGCSSLKTADALIAAGMKFDVDYSFTATFNHMQQARIDYLEYRAEVAERALLFLCDKTMNDISVMVFPSTKTQVQNKQELYDYCIKQATQEIEEEKRK